MVTRVHVDDFLSIATTKRETESFKGQMETKGTISDLGRAKQFLSIGTVKCLFVSDAYGRGRLHSSRLRQAKKAEWKSEGALLHDRASPSHPSLIIVGRRHACGDALLLQRLKTAGFSAIQAI